MLFLAIAFFFGVVSLLLFAKSRSNPASVSLPQPKGPTPSPTETLPTLAPNELLLNLENDLIMIEGDLKKMKEDNRFQPPSFIFSLGLKL